MEAARKIRLGQKWTCYSCTKKFYDLQKAPPVCPSCNANQEDRPPDELALKAKKKTTRKKAVRKTAKPKAKAKAS